MKRHAEASFAGSIAGNGSSRGLVHTGSRLFAVLALAVCGLVLSAGPASAAPPTATMGSVSEVLGASAHFTGEVDPGTENTCWSFDYSTDGVAWSPFGFQGCIGAADDPSLANIPQPVSVTRGNLQPSTKYFVRLSVSDYSGQIIASSPSSAPYPEFTTLAVTPPTVSLLEAAELGNTSVLAKGTVSRAASSDPAFTTNCGFEYITDAAFQPVSEKQRLVVKASGGTFTLSFGGQTTAPLAYNADPGTVQAAFAALSSVGSGNVIVTGGPGSVTGSQPYTFSFIGALGSKNVGDINADGSALTTEAGQGVPKIGTEVLVQGHSAGFEGSQARDCSLNPITEGGSFPVTASLPELQGNTLYHLRLRASNQGGEDTEVTTFKTTAVVAAQTLAPNIGAESATLVGRIDAFNAPVNYQFEWGRVESEGDETYENKAPLTPQSLGTPKQGLVSVSAQVVGLLPQTTYHYRITATNTQTSQVALGTDRAFTTDAAPPPPPGGNCPNASSQVGPSASLPDCRAWEFVSPGLNAAGFFNWPAPVGGASDDGRTIVFETKDAPLSAEGGSPQNIILAKRGPNGWHLTSTVPPMPSPQAGFFTVIPGFLSADLENWVSYSSIPPTPETELTSPGIGVNGGNSGYFYVRQANGKYSTVGTRVFEENQLWPNGISDHGTHVYYDGLPSPGPPQNGESEGGLYDWADGKVTLLSVLPGGGRLTRAIDAGSNGDAFGAWSSDGNRVLFAGEDPAHLYLRIDGKETVEVNESQRTPVESSPQQYVRSAGITSDGAAVYFIASAELTDDANTGTVGPAPGRGTGDLYRYDVASRKLTDLTVNNEAVNAATGADVSLVLGASEDGSYIYFTANGRLAAGGVQGQSNIYVWHDGKITYVAPGTGLSTVTPYLNGNLPTVFYVTPDGRHAAFLSKESLTGYNNVNPANNRVYSQAFEYTYGGGIACGSCRPDGAPPTADAEFASGFAAVAYSREGNHYISDDGSRMFFQSSDQIVPEAKNGLSNVFEYTGGKIYLLTPGDSPAPIKLLDASASGDDVFVAAMEELTPGEGAGEASSVYDARVGGTRPAPKPTPCSGENCRDGRTSPPQISTPATAGFEAPGALVAPKSASSKSSKLQLRVSVPGAGKVAVSGSGLKPGSQPASKAGVVAVTLQLKPGAKKTLGRKGRFKTTASLSFTSSAGNVSRASVSVKFETGKKKKGGK